MENSKFTVEFNSDNGGLKVHRSQERCRPHELDRRAWNLELSPRDGVPRSEAERRQSRFSRYRCSVLKETLERRAWAAIFCGSGSISATQPRTTTIFSEENSVSSPPSTTTTPMPKPVKNTAATHTLERRRKLIHPCAQNG